MYGNILRNARKSKQLKLTDMAKVIGFTFQYYDRIERQASSAKNETIQKICEVLELDFNLIIEKHNNYWLRKKESTSKLKKEIEKEEKIERKNQRLGKYISTKNIEEQLWKK